MPTRDIYGKNGPLNDMEEAERIEQMKKEQEQRTSAPVVTATPAATQTQTAAPQTATEQPTRRGMDAFLSYLQGEIDKRRAESDEERKKREKREKTQAVIAGIADIGSAIGNMVHAYHGGKSTFDPTQGMSQKYKELWEKNKAEREKMAAERMNYMMMKNNIESARAAAAQEQENWQKEYDLKAREQQEKSQARAEKNEYMRLYYEAKNKGEEARAAWYEAKSREADAKERGDIERANYWRNKADEIANGYTETTTKTDAHGRSETTVKDRKPSGKGTGNTTNGNSAPYINSGSTSAPYLKNK